MHISLSSTHLIPLLYTSLHPFYARIPLQHTSHPSPVHTFYAHIPLQYTSHPSPVHIHTLLYTPLFVTHPSSLLFTTSLSSSFLPPFTGGSLFRPPNGALFIVCPLRPPDGALFIVCPLLSPPSLARTTQHLELYLLILLSFSST